MPRDGILCVPEAWPTLPPPHPVVLLGILGTPPRAGLGCGHLGQLRGACKELLAPSLLHHTAGGVAAGGMCVFHRMPQTSLLGLGLVTSDDRDPLAENMGERKLLSWVMVPFSTFGVVFTYHGGTDPV